MPPKKKGKGKKDKGKSVESGGDAYETSAYA